MMPTRSTDVMDHTNIAATSASTRDTIPRGWRPVRVGQVADVRGSQVMIDEGEETVYIALEHISSGGALVGRGSSTEFISSKLRFKAGDTLYGKLRPNLRKVLRVPFDGVCSTEILPIFPKDTTDGVFLNEVLRSDTLHSHAMQGITGTKMPRTSWAHLKSYTFLLPPLAEQRAIAAVLDSIDGAIERTDEVIAATERLRDALLHELLTRGVPGWHSAWKDVPGLGTVPASWKVVRLGDRIEEGPTNGIYKPESEYGGGICLIRIDDFVPGALVNTGSFQRIRASEDERHRYAVREGDILINRVNSLSHIGKTVLIRELGEPTLFESNMMKLRMDSGVLPRFAEMVLLSHAARGHFVARAKKAVQQASINQQDVVSFPLSLPPLSEQGAITGMLDAVDAAVERARGERSGLLALKASASDALLTGRVRVGV